MVEKIYGKTGSIQEVNQLASNLRKLKMKEEVFKLAEENRIPKNDAEEFIQGKRYFLIDGGDTAKYYETARSKLMDEMLEINDPMFGNIIGGYLLQRCKDRNAEQQILKRHKTLQRCIEYLMEQAYGTADESDVKTHKNVSVAVADDMVFGWVNDYYASDDAEKVAQSVKEADEAFLRRRVPAKLPDKKKTAKKSASSQPKKDKQAKKEEVKTTAVKKEGTEKESEQVAGQVSLFEAGMMMG